MPLNRDGTSDDSSSSDDATSLDVARAALKPADGEQEAASDSSNEADDNKAQTQEPEKWDPISVVKKAVEDTRKLERPGDQQDGAADSETGDSSKPEDGQKKDDANKPAITDADFSDEELAKEKGKTRERMEFLLSERKKLSTEVDELRPHATAHQELTGFMRDNDLSDEHMAELMVVGALARSRDPEDLKSAIDRTEEFLNNLKLVAGHKLPDDLQKKVDEGLMDADSAKEVSLGRVKTQHAEHDVEVNTYKQKQEHQVRQVQDVSTTIADWQRKKIASDPDYSTKAEFLQAEIASRVAKAGGRVLDPAKATQIAEEAYAAVSEKVKKIIPKTPEAKKVITSRSSSSNMASMPSSPLEAARAGLKMTRGR